MTQREFFERMETACALAKAAGALLNTEATIAQAANESGWGNSLLTRRANNLFGIKAGSRWTGQTVVMRTREWSRARGYYEVDATWRAYPDWSACVRDYAALIARLSWFRDALPHADRPDGDGSAEGWLRAALPEPGQPGWATSPRYFEHVGSILPVYRRLMGKHHKVLPTDSQESVRLIINVAGGRTEIQADQVRLEEGRVWVRLRPLAEALRLKASWDLTSRTATVSEP